MTDDAALTVRFSGPSVENNQIDIQAMVSSLLGLTSAIERAGELGPAEGSQVRVRMGVASPGSWLAPLVAYLLDDPLATIAETVAILEFTRRAVLGAIKLVKARRDKATGMSASPAITPAPDDMITVTTATGASFTAPALADVLAQDQGFLVATGAVARALAAGYIDTMELACDGDSVDIEPDDLPAFQAALGASKGPSSPLSPPVVYGPPARPPVPVVGDRTESAVQLEVVAPSWITTSSSWRVRRIGESSSLWARMLDEDFEHQVFSGRVGFTAGSTIIADLRTLTYADGKKERLIEKVYD